MTDLMIHPPLADEIRQQAEASGVAAEVVLETALREYRRREQDQKLSAERQAWRALPPETQARYRGEYVAIHSGKVVDHDPDLSALHGRIRERYGWIAVLITPADGRRELVFRSPRLERSP
ncbi:MAG: hypothetical protein HY784_17010 [Chloroflexi bacterium]|nr:hypothetical protein [Chloroflexota bacterium]